MMRFIVGSFGLSFSIFVRAVPFWVILVSIIYAMFAFFSHAVIIPILFLILGAGPAMVFMMFAHVRSGLAVRGYVTPPDLNKLFKRALKFYRFYVMVLSIASFLIFCGFLLLAKYGYLGGAYDGSVPEFGTYSGVATTIQMIEAMETLNAQIYFWISSQVMTLVYCALAVPMAANAAACTARSRDTEVFWGLGSYMVRMYLISLLASSVLTAIVIAAVVSLAFMPILDAVSLVDLYRGQGLDVLETANYSPTHLIATGGVIAGGIVWTISLWCAAATNCYIDLRTFNETERLASLELPESGPEISVDELRAMRLSRQQSFA